MGITIRKKYTLGVVKGVGGNPTSLKLQAQANNSLFALYNGVVDPGVDDSRVREAAATIFEGLTQDDFNDFPKNMPMKISLTIEGGGTYTFKRKETKS